MKKVWIIILAVAAVGWLAIPGLNWNRGEADLTYTVEAAETNPSPASAAKSTVPDWTEYDMIAHGLGGISGYAVTNSYEAFVANYEKGHRVFEVDLILTSDEKLAARHDWYYYLSETLQPTLPETSKEGPIPYREFASHQILEKYKPIGIKKIVELLQKYPDIYIVTDTKETDPDLVRLQFAQIVQTASAVDASLLDRIIPELYTEEMIQLVQSLHPFKHFLFSLYLSDYTVEKTEEIIAQYGVDAIAMPTERATAEFVGALHDAGTVVYVHTVNDLAEVEALRAVGVDGFYTDFLTATDFQLAELRAVSTVATSDTAAAAAAAPQQAEAKAGLPSDKAQSESEPSKSLVRKVVDSIRGWFK